MTHVIRTALAALLIALPGLASADEQTGTVAEIDRQEQTITLEDGTTYRFEDFAAYGEGLGPGERVTIEYEERDGEKVVTNIDPVAEAIED